jgi:hypothetical protein
MIVIGPCPEMDKSSWLRVTVAPLATVAEVVHMLGWSKMSVKSKSPRPGLWSWVDSKVWVVKNVGVSVGGNQTMVGEAVWVSGTGVIVCVGAGGKLLHAAKKTSMIVPRHIKVSFIDKNRKNFYASCCTINDTGNQFTHSFYCFLNNSVKFECSKYRVFELQSEVHLCSVPIG